MKTQPFQYTQLKVIIKHIMCRFCQRLPPYVYTLGNTCGMLTRSHGFHGQAPRTADDTAFLERLNFTLLQPYCYLEYTDIYPSFLRRVSYLAISYKSAISPGPRTIC